MRVARWEKGVYGRAAVCAQEGSGVVRRRVALYTGGQRDCTQKGSGLCTGG